MSKARGRDVEKERHWRKVIGEAARSGLSIREFCRGRRLKESQFYWWQRKLKELREERMFRQWGGAQGSRCDGEARFALVSEEGAVSQAGLELVLGNGYRLRIGKGVDEETLRRVLAVLEPPGC